MQDPTPIPAADPNAKTLYAFFRDLFSRMAIGQCVHAALCVAVGAAIGLSTGRTSTALGIVLGVLAAAIGATICALWFRRRSRADHRGHTCDRRRALRHGAAGAARR